MRNDYTPLEEPKSETLTTQNVGEGVEHQELSVKERKCKNATATLKDNSAVS